MTVSGRANLLFREVDIVYRSLPVEKELRTVPSFFASRRHPEVSYVSVNWDNSL